MFWCSTSCQSFHFRPTIQFWDPKHVLIMSNSPNNSSSFPIPISTSITLLRVVSPPIPAICTQFCAVVLVKLALTGPVFSPGLQFSLQLKLFTALRGEYYPWGTPYQVHLAVHCHMQVFDFKSIFIKFFLFLQQTYMLASGAWP